MGGKPYLFSLSLSASSEGKFLIVTFIVFIFFVNYLLLPFVLCAKVKVGLEQNKWKISRNIAHRNSVYVMDRLLTVLLISMNSGFCFCSWTEDGGYVGLYPGGCAVQSDCPSDERCMHSVEETICPQNHENLCRCTLGCEVDSHIIRYEQWRPVPGKGFCKCLNSATNKSYCLKNMDL